MELFSFGSFVDLYLFCAERWNDKLMRDEHYMLRQVKSIRNACAHSSDIINGFAISDGEVETNANVQQAVAAAGISHRVRTARLRNPRLKQIATLMYSHAQMFTSGHSRSRGVADMRELAMRMGDVRVLISNNDAVRSSLTFLETLIDSWF